MYTPEKIRGIEFKKAGFNGFNAAEVDYFIEEVANDFEELIKQKEELNKKIQILADSVEEYRKSEDTVKLAILNAQKTADSIMKEAKANSKEIVEQHKAQAEDISLKAADAAEKLINDATARSQQMLDEATMRANSIIAEAEEKSKMTKKDTEKLIGQQLLTYNYIKDEIKKFRNDLIDSYRVHIDNISTIPSFNKNLEDYDEKFKHAKAVAMEAEKSAKAAENTPEPAEKNAKPADTVGDKSDSAENKISGGFTVNGSDKTVDGEKNDNTENK